MDGFCVEEMDFKKEYYILYLYSLELLRNQTILYIVISAIQSKFHRFFIFSYIFPPIFIYFYLLFFIDVNVCELCAHIC